MLARADVFVQNLKPGAVGKLGFPHRAAAPRVSAAHLLLDLRLRRERPVRDSARPTTADPGRSRPRRDHRHARRPARVGVSVVDIAAGMNAYEAILEALLARGAHRPRRRALDFHVRRHGRLDGGAAAAAGRGHAAAARRARPHLDRALRRLPQPRRRRHPDLHSERPRMARAGGKGFGRCRARRRSGIRHQRRARKTPRRDRWQGRRNIPRARRRAADAKTRRRRDRLRARKWSGGTRAPSASAPHHRATPSGPVSYPAPAEQRASASRRYGPVPALGEHTEKVRAEFSLRLCGGA